MTTIAIHQPNYLPWMGFFYKIARADKFVFLDDVQFSKNNLTNRVKILRQEKAKWLTQAVSYNFGDAINQVAFAKPDWINSHLDLLKGAYQHSPQFKAVWPDIDKLYRDLPSGDLATGNAAIVIRICALLDLKTEFFFSSALNVNGVKGDERLIRISHQLASGSTYLSGKGAQKYQDEEKFRDAGIGLTYSEFAHPVYEQSAPEFVPGLSIIDPVFYLGWKETGALLAA